MTRALGVIFLILLIVGGPVAVFFLHDEIAQAITRSLPKTDDTTPPAGPADYSTRFDALHTAIDTGNKTVVEGMAAQTGELKKALTEVPSAMSKEIEAKLATIPAQVAVQIAAAEKLFEPIGNVAEEFGQKVIGFSKQLGNRLLDLVPSPNCTKVDDVCEMSVASLDVSSSQEVLTEAPVGSIEPSIEPLEPSSEEPSLASSSEEPAQIAEEELTGTTPDTRLAREHEISTLCPPGLGSMDRELLLHASTDYLSYVNMLWTLCGKKTTLFETSDEERFKLTDDELATLQALLAEQAAGL
jgi:hypothetical protein